MVRWTSDRLKVLFDGVGSFGWRTLERRTGATRNAIWKAIQRYYGGGGITRGTYSLSQAMAETGYASTQLRRAARALGQRWNRTGKGSVHHFLITGEQLEEMAAWLKVDYWAIGLKLYGCTNCGTNEAPHHRVGMCRPCYFRCRRIAIQNGLPYRISDLIDIVRSIDIGSDGADILQSLRSGYGLNQRQLRRLGGVYARQHSDR